MSTRYVWGKYAVDTSGEWSSSLHNNTSLGALMDYNHNLSFADAVCHDENGWGIADISPIYASAYTLTGFTQYKVNPGSGLVHVGDIGTFKLSSPADAVCSSAPAEEGEGTVYTYLVPAGHYFLVRPNITDNVFYSTDINKTTWLSGSDTLCADMCYYCWYADTGVTLTLTKYDNDDNGYGELDADGTCHTINPSVAIGSTPAGYVSAAAAGTWGDGVLVGGNWLKYIGADSIDPVSVALESSSPTAGQFAAIAVSPRANSYGTVSYLYQYSTDGGSTWTTLALSSATTYSFTVPSGAKTLTVRARAQDNLGFTSADYVPSDAYAVTQTADYAGVSGVVRPLTAYAGVSGVVRTAVPKKGVDGVVRS